MTKLGHALGLRELSTAEAADADQVMRRMRWLTVVLPALFLLLLLVIVNLLSHQLPTFTAILIGFAVCAVGIVVFSRAVFDVIGRLQTRLQQQNHQLRALYEAGVQATANLSIEAVLQNVADSSRDLLKARQTIIIAVDGGRSSRMITSGLSADERFTLDDLPDDGLSAHIFRSGAAYRTADIRQEPLFRGYPAGLSAFTSFLSVPLRAHDAVIGHIFATDKYDGEFSDEDEAALKTLAVQAAIAIENARLYEDAHEAAVLKERERIAMDLHDGVIQQLYGISLKLDSGIEQLEADPGQVRDDIDGAIEDINAVIREIRSHIFDLRPQQLEGRTLREALAELLVDLSVNTLVTTDLLVGPDDPVGGLSDEQTATLVEIARLALDNILKHSHALNVSAEVACEDGVFSMRIVDDGVGVDELDADRDEGGIGSMRQKAHGLGGELKVGWDDNGGTVISVVLPMQPGEVQ